MLIFLTVVLNKSLHYYHVNEKIKARNLFRAFILIPFFDSIHFLIEFVMSLRYFNY